MPSYYAVMHRVVDSAPPLKRAPRMSVDPPGHRVSDTGSWQRIAEGLMYGLIHDLSSRASALSGIARMARMDVGFEETLLPLLESETSKLSRSVKLAKLLPRQRHAQPVSISELLPLVIELHSHHPDLEQIEYRCDRGTVVSVVDADSTLCHSLLAILSLLGWSALRDGYSAVDVRIDEKGSRIVIDAERAEASTSAANGGGVPEDLARLTEEMVRAVRLGAEEAGGEATAETSEGGLTKFELRLPAASGVGG